MSEDGQEAPAVEIEVGELCRTDFGALVLVMAILERKPNGRVSVMTMDGQTGLDHYVDLSMLDPLGERYSP